MQNGAIIDSKRKVEIWRYIIRHILSIVYLLAELNIGYIPPDLKQNKEQ
jgi:hypothetical protein